MKKIIKTFINYFFIPIITQPAKARIVPMKNKESKYFLPKKENVTIPVTVNMIPVISGIINNLLSKIFLDLNFKEQFCVTLLVLLLS